MIISASRRTDIPALYTEWFANRLDAGWCTVANPFNPKQISRVSLLREDVDAFVFWTRHAAPLFEVLPLLDRRGDHYYVHYTITGYGRPIELRAPPLETSLEVFRELASRLRPGGVVWRYDPILVGDAFPATMHRQRFERIAGSLEGHAQRVVVSIVDPYRKTKRRLKQVLTWGVDVAAEPTEWPGIDDLLADLARIARDHGMTPEACAEERDLTPVGIRPTRCIDDRLLETLFGGTWPRKKDPGQRKACGCIPSRDIGMTDTCTLGCAYCYATRSDDLARRNRREHDPRSPSLQGHLEPPDRPSSTHRSAT